MNGIVEDAKVSLRIITLLEIISVVLSILVTMWAIIPYKPPQRWLIYLPGLLAIGLIIHSFRVRRESLRDIGFTFNNIGAAARLLALPTVAAIILFSIIAFYCDSFHIYRNFKSSLLILPLWGTIQQFILQGFIYKRMRFLLVRDDMDSQRQRMRINITILITATLFALVHLPNPSLTLLTFIGGLIWSYVYERAPNLFAIGLSHAFMSMLLMATLPTWILKSMSVGYKYLLL